MHDTEFRNNAGKTTVQYLFTFLFTFSPPPPKIYCSGISRICMLIIYHKSDGISVALQVILSILILHLPNAFLSLEI